MSAIIDSYSESNSNIGQIIGDGSNFGHYYYAGQSITGNGDSLEKSTFYLEKYGSPTGNAYAKIYAHSGTFGTSSLPTGSPLATSDPFDVSTLTGGSVLRDLTFSGVNQIVLENNTHYIVVFGGLTGADLNNYVYIAYDNSSPTHNGNMCSLSGSWSYTASDLIFYVYGTTVTPPATPIVGLRYPIPPFKRS